MTVIGTLTLRDWDAGLPLTMGAEVATYTEDGDTREVNVVRVPGVKSGLSYLDDRIPVLYLEPEDVYQNWVLPCFTFKATALTTAFDRHPWYQWVARAPAKDAQKIVLPTGQVGYDRYENQWRATQFDIAYDVQVMGRRRQETNFMLHYALQRFLPPGFIFKVIDSLGDVREYDALEVSVSETSELADIADRTVAWTISFTVRGEIDLHETVEQPAVIGIDVTYARYPR